MSVVQLPVRGERDEWLRWRRQGIGGSDAAAIVGVSPYANATTVWLDKLGLYVSQQESEAMLWGMLLEGPIADEFERRTGFVVAGRQTLCTHPDWPVMRCTLDGLVYEGPRDEDEALGIYEGKTTHGGPLSDWTDGVPQHVECQVQHNLACSGRERAWVTLLRGGQKLEIFEVAADRDLQAFLIAEERAFWQYVLEGRPPPVDSSERTAEALRAAYAEPAGGIVVLPPEALELVARYQDAKAAEKSAAEAAQGAQNELMQLLGEHEVGVVGDREIVTWRSYETSRVDLDALRQAHPAIATEFTRTTRARRFAIPKEKP